MRASLSRLALGFLLATAVAAPSEAQTTTTPKADATKGRTRDATPKKTAAKLDLNTATEAELQELPGIGPARAAAIIKARPFKTVAELKAIRGISPTVYSEVAPHVTVAAPEAPATKPAMPRDTAAAAKGAATTTKKAATPKSAAVAAAKEDDPEHQARKKAALPAGKLINLNTATTEELEELPYIGPVRSAAIIKARPFATTDDVMRVEGIKEGIFAHIKDHITVK